MRKLFFRYFSPLFFIGAFFFFIYSIPTFHIRQTFIVGTEKTDKDIIAEIIANKLSEKYLYILDKDHIFFYPEEKIKQDILDSNQRIKTAKIIYKNLWRDIEVQITERQEKHLYCQKRKIQSEVDTEYEEVESCRFMDEEGMVFDFTKRENNLIKFYGSQEIYQKQMIEIEKIINRLQTHNLVIQEIIQDELGNVSFILQGGSKILLKFNFTAEKILLRINIIFSYHDFKIDREKKQFENKIYYINMRHGHKIYYCLNDQRCAGNY